MKSVKRRTSATFLVLIAAGSLGLTGLAASASANPIANQAYQQTNLVSDIPGLALHTDPNLRNSWGTSTGPGLPIWVSDNATGAATLYDGQGNPQPGPGSQQLVVTIPAPPSAGPGAASAPDGTAFNPTPDGFLVSRHGVSAPARFLFATEDGTIAGWAPDVDLTHAVIGADRTADDASYKGLALATTAAGDRLFAADFHNRRIDVFDAMFMPVHTPNGAFSDRRIPSDYAPFNVQNLGGKIFVAYAKVAPGGEDEQAGAGLGFVDVYNTTGRLVDRFAQHGALNAPWGMAQAPRHFGRFSGDILVGNFGDGRILAFDREGHFDGYLRGVDHTPIEIDGLWGIGFGNGKQAGPTDTLFFAAGTNDEADGLFGSLRLASDS